MSKPNAEQQFRKTGQIAGLTIAGAGLATILAPWIVAVLQLPARFEMLIYLGALAAMAWALVVAWGMWRKRREMDKG